MKISLRPIILYLIVLAILPDSISAQNNENDQDQNFTMIIASDPQFFLWKDGWKNKNFDCTTADYKGYEKPNACIFDCKSILCAKAMAIKTNEWQVNAMNNITKINNNKWPNTVALSNENRILKPKGVIMNGDLVHHGAFKFQEWKKYKKYYDNGKKTVLKLPIFPGLGNHDYKSPVDDNNQSYAVKAIKYIDNWSNQTHPPFTKKFSYDYDKKRHEGSLSYSFDIKKYHFIQLHNYPGYETTFSNGKNKKKYVINNSFNWLKNDIQKAYNRGQKIVINMHDHGDKFNKKGDNSDFMDAIKGKNIVAIFAGHKHVKNGFQKNLIVVETGDEIPVFYSGSSLKNTFLLVDFGPSSMTVGVIERKRDDSADFKERENQRKLKTYTFASIK